MGSPKAVGTTDITGAGVEISLGSFERCVDTVGSDDSGTGAEGTKLIDGLLEVLGVLVGPTVGVDFVSPDGTKLGS